MNTTQGDANVLPVLYQHCKDVYERMLAQSTKQEYKDGDEDKVAIVYEGFLTKLVTEQLHLSVPYYTSVRRALQKMGCCSQLRRGGSTSPSQWRLFHEPTEELFRDKVLGGKKLSPTSQYQTRLDQVENSMHTLNRRVLVLEGILGVHGNEGMKDVV